MSGQFDAVIVGGGIMGCATALELASEGLSVLVLERGGLCMGASGVNAGTLSIQNKPPELLEYALRSLELWRNSSAWLGTTTGFTGKGGLCLAFTDDEAAKLEAVMAEKRNRGVPVELLSPGRAREKEPGLNAGVRLASWCPADSYANSYQLGHAFRAALKMRGVQVLEDYPLDKILPEGSGYEVRAKDRIFHARRIVITGGYGTGEILKANFDIDLPLKLRANQIHVTERSAGIRINHIIGAIGQPLTLKQSGNGTILIGGGWDADQGADVHDVRFNRHNYIANLRLAVHAIPALKQVRLVRSWIGTDGSTEDGLPLMGRVPGQENAFVLAAVRGGGYTVGPCLARCLAGFILEREILPAAFAPDRPGLKVLS